MFNTLRWAIAPVALASLLTGCEPGDSSVKGLGLSGARSSQVRSLVGRLKLPAGQKVALAAKTSGGKVVKAVVDPKSNRFSLNLPKNETAVLTVKAGSEVKKVKFVRQKGRDGAESENAASDENLDYAIPNGAFERDADLGELDFEEGSEILCGDEEGENSPFEYTDIDADGEADFSDLDDDNDGVPDLSDEDWEMVLAWLEEEGDWGDEGWYDEQDMCDLDAEAAGLCEPADEEFFGEDECDEAGSEEYCYGEEEEGWYDTPDEEEWWCACEGEADLDQGDLSEEDSFEGTGDENGEDYGEGMGDGGEEYGSDDFANEDESGTDEDSDTETDDAWYDDESTPA